MVHLTRDVPPRDEARIVRAYPVARPAPGLPEALFTTLSSAVFLVLLATAIAAVLIYARGG